VFRYLSHNQSVQEPENTQMLDGADYAKTRKFSKDESERVLAKRQAPNSSERQVPSDK